MKIAKIQFSIWDRPYDFDCGDIKLKPGDMAIVETEIGLELGEVLEVSEKETAEEHKPVIRKATAEDRANAGREMEKREALRQCKELIRKHSLPMKLVDARISFDGRRVTFAFIADGRVDFRELVKDLTRTIGSSIRLQQIGIRDEAKMSGDIGHCGRNLCCGQFLGELSSITSDMADLQQCSHRGSDRISGICGRLMCCLAYEANGYKNLASNLPPIGARIKVDGRPGTVVGHHVLKQSLNVEFDDVGKDERTVVEIPLKGEFKIKM